MSQTTEDAEAESETTENDVKHERCICIECMDTITVHIRGDTTRKVAGSLEKHVFYYMDRNGLATEQKRDELGSVVDSLYKAVSRSQARNEMMEIQLPEDDKMQEYVSEALQVRKDNPYTLADEVGEEIDELIDQLEA